MRADLTRDAEVLPRRPFGRDKPLLPGTREFGDLLDRPDLRDLLDRPDLGDLLGRREPGDPLDPPIDFPDLVPLDEFMKIGCVLDVMSGLAKLGGIVATVPRARPKQGAVIESIEPLAPPLEGGVAPVSPGGVSSSEGAYTIYKADASSKVGVALIDDVASCQGARTADRAMRGRSAFYCCNLLLLLLPFC